MADGPLFNGLRHSFFKQELLLKKKIFKLFFPTKIFVRFQSIHHYVRTGSIFSSTVRYSPSVYMY